MNYERNVTLFTQKNLYILPVCLFFENENNTFK